MAAAAGAAWGSDDLDEPGWGGEDASGAPAQERQRSATPQREPVPDDRGAPAPNPRDQVSKRQAQDPADLFGPAWEKPRRYEAYPSLRTRVALPGVGGLGRVGLGALGLAVAALALFLIGPLLLGIGGGDRNGGGGGTGTQAPSAAVEPSESTQPTPVPAPTPQVYAVRKGDTISKIAAKFHLATEVLLKANPQIKDPNKISIGDPITIPVAGGAGDGSVEGASATP
jgi:LysM repeat protein